MLWYSWIAKAASVRIASEELIRARRRHTGRNCVMPTEPRVAISGMQIYRTPESSIGSTGRLDDVVWPE